MAITVATGWHPAGWQEYARRFVETFSQHWPADIGLVAYTEEPVEMPRGECRSLRGIEGAAEFAERHAAIPEHTGRAPVVGWRAKDHQKRYGWRWDAFRFFKQCVIPAAVACDLPDGDALAWLDADVVTFADVPDDLVDGLLGSADLCYLGRREGSEIGFWAVRLNPRSRAFLDDLASLYLDDRIFALPQYHSAFAFDHARQEAQRHGLITRDLTPGGGGHTWMRCKPLMSCTDHCKGHRKAIGHSPEHPLQWWKAKAA